MDRKDSEQHPEPGLKTKRNHGRRRLGDRSTPPKQVFDTIESAAVKLSLDPDALRARCRRAAERVGDTVVAQLGGGIVAFKFGKSWRIRFPSAM